MTFPTVNAIGSQFANAGAPTVPWPASHATNDIGLLLIQTNGQGSVIDLTAAGWTQMPDSPQSVGTPGAAGAVSVSAWWRRALSGAEADVIINDSGDHQLGRMVLLRGCETAGNPWNASNGGTQGVTGTAYTLPGGATAKADSLIVQFVGHGIDTASSQFSGQANADLASFTVQNNSSGTQGNGGGYSIITGQFATAGGTFGSTTGTIAASSLFAGWWGAFHAPGAAGPGGSGSVPAIVAITEGL